ncbi:La-related protein 6A [Camellia lanceoleosa]|uniref:La-related protein 6A n=1 Tax=Camellia lanceoleosa TaxID=1840588 RepID=A0ACC0GKJ7_9ERIC|nr:La-related protein 6A [Camellia lanceoleosa]
MEGDGVTTTSAAVAVAIPTPPPHDPDFSPVGSPEIADHHFEDIEEEEEEEIAPHASADQKPHQTPTLTDDLRDKIIKQATNLSLSLSLSICIFTFPVFRCRKHIVMKTRRVFDWYFSTFEVEYYFSDENLPNDKFLMNYVTKDVEGFVPIAVIASFRKMKRLTHNSSLIVAALKQSSFLVVSSNSKVRRLLPFPVAEVMDPKLCTVLVENLPEDHSTENIQRIFGEAGNIKNICIRDPHVIIEPKKRTIAEKLLSGKLHVLVEYETVEAAEKAVAMLNDEQDWRYGMRVKLLKKRAVKHGQKNKGSRRADSEKNNNVHASDPAGDEENHYSSEHHDDTHDEEDGDHISKEKNGYKGRNRRRGKGQRYRGTNGQGHGTVSSSHGSEPIKPPPGPRMPDGTKGFTMGRGRPLASNQN